MEVTRRQMIVCSALSGTGLLAGCTELVSMSDPGLTVVNGTDTELAVDIDLADQIKVFFEESTTIAPNDSFTRSDVLPSSGTVALSITVEDAPSDHHVFDLTEDDKIRAEIRNESIEFQKTK